VNRVEVLAAFERVSSSVIADVIIETNVAAARALIERRKSAGTSRLAGGQLRIRLAGGALPVLNLSGEISRAGGGTARAFIDAFAQIDRGSSPLVVVDSCGGDLLVPIYRARTGLDAVRLGDMLRAELTLNAAACRALGFVDRITGGG
jgi:hypothetical protein